MGYQTFGDGQYNLSFQFHSTTRYYTGSLKWAIAISGIVFSSISQCTDIIFALLQTLMFLISKTKLDCLLLRHPVYKAIINVDVEVRISQDDDFFWCYNYEPICFLWIRCQQYGAFWRNSAFHWSLWKSTLDLEQKLC